MALGILLPIKPDGSCKVTPSEAVQGVDIAGLWRLSGATGRPYEVKLFYGQGVEQKATLALVGTGDTSKLSVDDLRERSRIVTAVGVKALRDAGCGQIEVDTGCRDIENGGLDPHVASAAAHLALHHIDWKTGRVGRENGKPTMLTQSGEDFPFLPHGADLNWATGRLYGRAQNFCRELKDTPASLMTPTIFADRVREELRDADNVVINVYDEDWARQKGMNTFLSVAAGTSEPAKFLEIIYNGSTTGTDIDVALVGKGVTFDSGGISLKSGETMKRMRADMGGAAAVVCSTIAVAAMKIPINIVTVTPLTENMPGPSATKPGDIITTMSGKTVEVDNTDAEGRLILADALYYATSVYKPNVCIDVATLTGSIKIALGEAYSGVFCTDDKLWSDLEAAGAREHDRFWRMPLDESYLKYIDGTGADLCNSGGTIANACTAAIFLKQFVVGHDTVTTHAEAAPVGRKIAYAHIDTSGTMMLDKLAQPYDVKGMSGKPTRAIIEYIRQRVYGR